MYHELSRYVAANRYEQDTCIGMHSDFNVCDVVPPPPSTKWPSVATLWQMGVLWISPTTNSIKHDVSGNKSIDWIKARWNRKTADNGKLRYYAEEKLVIPIWCPQNRVLVMGGTFQQNMCHWTEKSGGYVLNGLQNVFINVFLTTITT